MSSHNAQRPGIPTRSCSNYDIRCNSTSMSLGEQEDLVKHFSELAKKMERCVSSSNEIFVRSVATTETTEGKAQEQQQQLSVDAATNGFKQSTLLFNSAAPLAAWIVSRPSCVEDVMATIKFCAEHGLSPSIRSGGYATAGWSIQGDVVLDMRAMNQAAIVPPSARFLQHAASERRSRICPDELTSAKGRAAAGDDGVGGSVEEGLPKRRRENDYANVEGLLSDEGAFDANVKLPLPFSADSGADADEELSNDSKRSGNHSEESSDEEKRDSLNAKSRAVVASPPLMVDSGMTTMKTDWTDTIGQTATSTPQSGDAYSSGPSFSGENGGASLSATSVDAEMHEIKSDGAARVSASDDQRSSEGNSDRGSQQQRHRLLANGATSGASMGADQPDSSSRRLVLPKSGGFIWTAGEGSAESLGTTTLLDSTAPVYVGGETFGELRAAHESVRRGEGIGRQSQNRIPQNSHTGATPALSSMNMDQSLIHSKGLHERWDRTQSSAYVQPGVHKDNFVYVEFGPGVGVRDLDIFTEREGRKRTFDRDDDERKESGGEEGGRTFDAKGKSRMTQAVDVVHADQNSLQVCDVDGVPYHVPLSAFPVGSTAMTIGGFGYLSRAYGLSLDNIVEIDIVLADGRLKTLNASVAASDEDEEARDLWWAVRGAAPCFGVVTRIVAKAYAVPQVYAGNLIYPFNPATAPSLIRHWRDCLKGTGEQIPRELYSNLILTAGPSGGSGEHVIVIQMCFLGTGSSEEIGYNFVQAITSWTGERVLLKDISERSFLSQQDGVAQVLKSGQGKRWMVRGDLLTTLTDEVIALSVAQFCTMGNRAVWLFELVGGAIGDRIGQGDTCVGEKQRLAKFTAGALQQWVERDEDDTCVRGVETWLNDVLAPVSVGGPFAAFLERGESRTRCQGSFGEENFARLLRIKRAIDPQGMFCHTFGRGLVQFAAEDDPESPAEGVTTAQQVVA